jgi:hypothetical protein
VGRVGRVGKSFFSTYLTYPTYLTYLTYQTYLTWPARSGSRYAASRADLNSSFRRATLPAIECSDGVQPSARARGLRTT